MTSKKDYKHNNPGYYASTFADYLKNLKPKAGEYNVRDIKQKADGVEFNLGLKQYSVSFKERVSGKDRTYYAQLEIKADSEKPRSYSLKLNVKKSKTGRISWPNFNFAGYNDFYDSLKGYFK